jgi:guanine deaminase
LPNYLTKAIDVNRPYEGITPIDDVKSSIPTTKEESLFHNIRAESNQWIRMACEEAKASVERGGGPFGAVLVQIDDETNEVIRYWRDGNHVTDQNDPTAHAEISVIRAACHQLGLYTLNSIPRNTAKLPQVGETSHCELYSSCEPCPMCYSAVMWARIPVLVFSATRFDAALPGVDFIDAKIYDELSKRYEERLTRVYVSSCNINLEAFHLWKQSENRKY